nr:fructose-bisphosphate aldolase-lysine N-methyltransferase, chloroplastic isoform X8 [Oryza sativa Japonica Group]
MRFRFAPRRCAAAAAASASKGGGGGGDCDCSVFLRWLRSKSGTHISSVLSLGTSSAFGSFFCPFRSLFASEPIQEGDCIMQVPYHVQLTLDKLPQKFNTLLDHAVGDTSKLAALLIMEQHLGNESGWAPYIKSLPTKDQMHNMVLWDLNELHAVQNSSIYDEAIEHKEQAKKEFLALKPALDHFPHLFGEVKLGDFMHASALVSSRAWRTPRGVLLIPFADFLNHDGVFGSVLIYDEQKDVCEIIADRNYAVGEQVMIRYGKYSNATLALNFGFTLARNIYDQALIRIDMPVQDPLYKKKLDIWQKHRLPIFEDMCNLSSATSFVIKLGRRTSGCDRSAPSPFLELLPFSVGSFWVGLRRQLVSGGSLGCQSNAIQSRVLLSSKAGEEASGWWNGGVLGQLSGKVVRIGIIGAVVDVG